MDSTEKKWFRRKTYGYGWTPASWEGWLVTLLYLVFIVGAAQFYGVYLKLGLTEEKRLTIFFFLSVALATAILIKIAVVKGETPRWQWGNKKIDN